MSTRVVAPVLIALSLSAIPPSPVPLVAQTNWDAVQIRTTPVRGGVTLLAAAGGNLAVFAGGDGVLVVDADYAELSDRILGAIRELAVAVPASGAPTPGASGTPGTGARPAASAGAGGAATVPLVRYLVNTHWHFDHVAGNEAFARAGAIIIAHERVRRLMSEDRVMGALGERRVQAAPAAALPVLTFNDRLNLAWNGDLVHLVHMPAAHTDGDIIVHFRDADVIHMGDLFFNGMYPFIDVEVGGNIAGMVRAVGEVLDHTPPTTLFIPGHGPLAGRADLERYRDMLATVQGRVQEMIDGGLSREEVLAARPTADFDPVWAGEGSFLAPDVWVGLVYDGLVRGGGGGAGKASPAFHPPVAPLLGLSGLPVGAQQPRDTVGFLPARADALTGLYVLEDGRLVHVMDLRDQMRGEPALSATEYASGRARALFPRADGYFDAGNAWFRWDSIAYRVRFDETTRPAPGLTWEEGGRVLSGRRAPLVEREVTIRNGEILLAGSLVLPPGPGPHPALVIVPGSGGETRRIPRQVGDLLAYHGVAVLVTDKRGTGGSGGSWNGLSHADWATDVEAQLDFLRAQPEIDADRIGLIGNSEGGYVVPVVAARRPDVRFLVCRVCSFLPHGDVIPDIETGSRRRRGMAEEDVAASRELIERMVRYALTGTGYDSLRAHFEGGAGKAWRESFPLQELAAPEAHYWDVYRGVLVVDPREHYPRLDIPVLAVLGEADDRVLIDRHRPVLEALSSEGLDLTLWVVPEASHGLMLGPGNALGYPPGLHDRLVEWVLRASGAKGVTDPTLKNRQEKRQFEGPTSP